MKGAEILRCSFAVMAAIPHVKQKETDNKGKPEWRKKESWVSSNENKRYGKTMIIYSALMEAPKDEILIHRWDR